MENIINYFERKGFTIWNVMHNDVEGTKGDFYLNVIKNDLGYLIIMSIRGTPRFTHKQLTDLDEIEMRRMYNRMKNCEIYRVPDMTNDEYENLRFPIDIKPA